MKKAAIKKEKKLNFHAFSFQSLCLLDVWLEVKSELMSSKKIKNNLKMRLS